MKEYGYLQALFKSFYSPGLYRDVARNWGGGVVFYLFLVILIAYGAMSFKYQPKAKIFIKDTVAMITGQLPEMAIVNGELKTPENRPYFITDPDTKEVGAIIDTSGQYTTLQPEQDGAIILITKNQMFFYDREAKTTRIKNIPETMTVNISPVNFKEAVNNNLKWIWVPLAILASMFMLIIRLMQALFYAFLGKIAAYIMRIQLRYSQIYKLAVVAFTPTIIIETVINCVQTNIFYPWWASFIITMGYVFFAIRSNKNINTTF